MLGSTIQQNDKRQKMQSTSTSTQTNSAPESSTAHRQQPSSSQTAIVIRHSFLAHNKLLSSVLCRSDSKVDPPLKSKNGFALTNPFDVCLVRTLKSEIVQHYHLLQSCQSKFQEENGNILLMLVADYSNHRVLILTSQGDYLNQVSVGFPHAICIDETREEEGISFLVTDCGEHVVKRFDLFTGKLLQIIGKGYGSDLGQFKRPSGLCLDSNTNMLYVTDYDNARIQVFDLHTGDFVKSFGDTSKLLDGPWGIAIDYHLKHHDPNSSTFTIYVCDSHNHCVRMFDHNGEFVGDAIPYGIDNQLKNPYHVIVDGNQLLVTDSFHHCVKIFSKHHHHKSTFISTVGSSLFLYDEVKPDPNPVSSLKTPSDKIEFHYPMGMALDVFSGRLFIADCGNHRIQVIS